MALIDPSGLEALGRGQGGHDRAEPLGEQRLAGAWRPNHEDVEPIGDCMIACVHRSHRFCPFRIQRRNGRCLQWRNKLLRQLGRIGLEQLPEVERGQLQAQRLVRADVLPRAGAERVAVPVQPLQVEHRLRHPPVSRLLHPQHAVHALDRAAGPERVPQHRRDPVVGGPLRLVQRRGRGPPPGPVPSRGSAGRGRRCRSHQRQAIASRHCATRLGRLQPAVHPVQEGQAPPVVQEVADLRPVGAGQVPSAPRRSRPRRGRGR